MHQRIILALTVVLTCGILRADPEQEAIDGGVRFLLGSQKEDGSWWAEIGESQDPGMRIAITALCAHALLASSQDKEVATAAERALGFLTKNLDALDGPFDVNPEFNFNHWGVAFGLVHLQGMARHWPGGKEPDGMRAIVQSLLAKARATQLPCGGWNYCKKERDGSPLKDGSVSFLTASMIEGILRWKEAGVDVDASLLENAVKDLEKTGENRASWPYSHSGRYESGAGKDGAGRTVQAKLILVEAGRAQPDSLPAVLDAFFQARGEFEKLRNTYRHAEPTMIAGYYYYYAHHYAARAIRRLGRDPSDYVAQLRKIFLQERNSDGSWKDVEAGGKTYGTAMVLIAFQELRGLQWRSSLAEALSVAATGGKTVLAFFTDGKKEAQETEKALADASLAETLARFVCIRVAARKDDADCKRARATFGSTILILDPTLSDPLVKPLRKYSGVCRAKSLKEDLTRALKALEKE